MVNDTPMYVSEDISFPFWLESGSSIDIGEGVASISIIEFSITSQSTENILNFIQTRNIKSHETCPDKTTWKIESVLLDTVYIDSLSPKLFSGLINKQIPLALSEQSINSMNFGEAMCYCDSLNESGHNDWVIPSLDEIIFISSGGGITPNERTSDYLWTTSINSFHGSEPEAFIVSYVIRLSDGSLNFAYRIGENPMGMGTPKMWNFHTRCLRYANY